MEAYRYVKKRNIKEKIITYISVSYKDSSTNYLWFREQQGYGTLKFTNKLSKITLSKKQNWKAQSGWLYFKTPYIPNLEEQLHALQKILACHDIISTIGYGWELFSFNFYCKKNIYIKFECIGNNGVIIRLVK